MPTVPEVPLPSPAPRTGARVGDLLHDPSRRDRLTHVEHLPARPGESVDWPAWVPDLLRSRLALRGVTAPWRHQAEAAELAWSGQDVVVATGTASGKSLAYQLPVLSALLADDRATALYLAPTKALAVDQLRAVRDLALVAVRAAAYDGDTPPEERDWVRRHARLVLSNPDLLHRTVLPRHTDHASFLRHLRVVVVDECHVYRGVFGSHVAHVLRRLLRLCRRYGASPVVVLASATTADPAATATRLLGRPVLAVTQDAAPHGATDVALWEPPLLPGDAPGGDRGEHGAPVRRPATAETADLLADLVVGGARTLAFVRSRRGAESVALAARRALAEVAPELAPRVAAYRAGYLPEERRALEAGLQDGTLLGVAATNALELGVDVAGLDAVLIAGWPGTRASLLQQAGRAGRAGQDALAVLVARDDPLDTYLVHHPEALFGRPVEATVLDPANPYVLGPQLCCAAAEVPLTAADLDDFGGTDVVRPLLDDLVRRGLLRSRPAGWFWTSRERPTADLRGTGGAPVRLVETTTGRLLGTVDAGSAHHHVHPGAVYLHQGVSWVVEHLLLPESLPPEEGVTEPVALLRREEVDHSTSARDVTDVTLVEAVRQRRLPGVTLAWGTVDVTHQVVSFLRRRLGTREVIGEEPLDLPPRQLRTRAVWYAVDDDTLAAAGFDPTDPTSLPGAAHAAEHAAIGLLPLFATCDRWDIGGVSTARHPDTGVLTVVVYDGHPGGAGFAERGYERAGAWLRATRDAITACTCPAGCPSCVQSPKCGNGNEPLDKAGAVLLLDAVLGAGVEDDPA